MNLSPFTIYKNLYKHMENIVEIVYNKLYIKEEVLLMSQNGAVNTNEHLLSRQEKWINFTPKETKHLFFYYIVLLIFSLLWISFSVLYHYEFSEKGFSNIIGIFMFACPGGLLGAVIYYIRKLYKSCIQNLIEVKSDDEAFFRKIGAKMYFYIRPIISAILAILVDMGFIAGFYFINNQPNINNDKFFLFIILISFYVGFCNGKIIINMEKRSEDVANFVLKEKENKNG